MKKNLPETKRLEVKIDRLIAKSEDSCNGEMDFYAKIKIGNKKAAVRGIMEGNNLRLRWSDAHNVPASGLTKVIVEIFDEDDPICGGNDDRVDVNPGTPYGLSLYVDTKTRIIYSDSNRRNKVGRANSPMTFVGDAFKTHSALNLSAKNIEAAQISLRIMLR